MIELELFLVFFKIGLFTFGGGYAMLPLIQSEVSSRQWMAMEDLINFIAVSESTPGPFAVNIATYVGMVRGGISGSLCATLGVVLPSFLVILLIAKAYDRFRHSSLVQGCMSGLKPAVIGMIASALISMANTVFFPEGLVVSVFQAPEFYLSAAIFAISLLLILKKLHPIKVICLCALLGIAAGFFFELAI